MEWKKQDDFTPPLHRHRRKEMDASEFKRRQLGAIEKRKRLKRLLFVALSVLAVLMFVAVVVAYFTD